MRLIAYKITYLEVLERVDNLFTPNSNQCTKIHEQNSTLQKFYQRFYLNGNTMGFYPQTQKLQQYTK